MKTKFLNTLLMSRQAPQAGNAPALGTGPTAAPLSPTELAQRLQTSLELERTLELFTQAIQWAFPHDGMTYDHPGLGLHLSWGRLSRHSCCYNLVVEREEIGELRFLRGRKFREEELTEVENLLSVLIYPLRNSLLYRQAVEAAQTDTLTGLYNRAALDHLLPRELAALRRGQQHLALLVVDIDHFKRINDTLGHSAGDQVLKAAADCLQEATRESDMLFRYGGEEFVMLMSTESPEDALLAGERIRRVLRNCEALQSAAPGFTLTASIGVAMARPTDSAFSLFDRADQAMYTAKQAGRDRVVRSEE
ncbi:putative diguanylate cyclase [Thioalkalivibrio sulfidiphilus HL-EbGr7]|uniref:diguanylate cyclase n=1 Tax=Thioalkalivibrio sulfidiphilus (strain HL-EbGR7) TaxID=396588 RepID=B8GME9_THISH|nr:GGDEF domain-containing protein [Thioalkalivibrio sulfidiphilus]ACL71781.1 putative diguanylate cyclase [Thioalkalivibrio sulfidiphilus HL-EbGr7]